MKLKIGTVAKKKKETVDGNMTDYLGTLSNEELQDMQEEVEEAEEKEGILNSTMQDEILEEKEEELEKIEKIGELINNGVKTIATALEDDEIEEAVNGLNIFNEVGIIPKYVIKFNELYPNKKTIYRNLITKQFLKWYIKTAKISQLKKLEFYSDHINKSQQEQIAEAVYNRLHEKIEIEVEQEEFVLGTDEEIDMYNFLLSKKWDKKDTKKIIELNDLIYEQMRVNRTNVSDSLKHLIETFKLDFEKKNVIQRELEEEHSLLDIKEKKGKKGKKEKQYATSKDIQKSIRYFHHIEFLYKLMSSPKMEFVEKPTEEDIEKITKIKELLGKK